MKENDCVTLAREILQDLYYKSRHFLLEDIVNKSESGTIRFQDHEKSIEQGVNYYWIKFSYATILIDEKYLVPAEELI